MTWNDRAEHAAGTRSRAAAWLSLLGLLACADPKFENDGDAATPGSGPSGNDGGAELCATERCPDASESDGASGVSSSDAEPSDGAIDESDPIRDKWVGRYAVRTAMYSLDGILQGVAQMLSLVEIKRSGAGLVLEEQLCKFDGGWNAVIVEGRLRFVYPPEKRTAEVTYTADRFSSATNVFTFGYGELPAGCANATSLTLSPQPPWLTGDCLCVQGGGPPSDRRDCRILDPEGDRQPASTFDVQINGAPWVYYATQEERVRYLDGYKQGDRLFAGQEALDNTKILGCSGPPDCTIGAAVVCPPKYNRSEFVPVPSGFGCTRIIEEEAGLFPIPLAPFPAGCLSDVK